MPAAHPIHRDVSMFHCFITEFKVGTLIIVLVVYISSVRPVLVVQFCSVIFNAKGFSTLVLFLCFHHLMSAFGPKGLIFWVHHRQWMTIFYIMYAMSGFSM